MPGYYMLFKCYTYTLLFRYVPPGFGNKDYIESFIVLIWRGASCFTNLPLIVIDIGTT